MRIAAILVGSLLLSLGGSTAHCATLEPPYSVRWIKEFAGEPFSRGADFAADANGDVFVAGTLTPDPNVAPSMGDQAFLAKYDRSGAQLWHDSFGGGGADRGSAVVVDSVGSAYIVGYTDGVLVGPGGGNYDGFIRKYQPDGTIAWTRQFGSVGPDSFSAAAIDKAGNIYAYGSSAAN